MLTVVTGWSPSGWKEYGSRFIDSFSRRWPEDVRLICYVEQYVKLPRGEQRLLSEIPGCVEFLDKYRDDAEANGRKDNGRWKEKDKANGYNYRFDAWKFCRQGFIPLHAAESIRSGLMCWLDADVVTFKDVPRGLIESLLPESADIAYLGREPKHSEIGFQLYRIPEALPMLRRFSRYYKDETVFQLKEWHSAFVFDTARKDSGIKAHNVTPDGRGHVWFQSPLGKYLDHLKGNRKSSGQSRERVA